MENMAEGSFWCSPTTRSRLVVSQKFRNTWPSLTGKYDSSRHGTNGQPRHRNTHAHNGYTPMGSQLLALQVLTKQHSSN